MNTTDLATVTENSRQMEHMKVSRLDDSLYSKDLAPHYMQLATKLASSELIPKSFRGKPQDLFICWAMGYQVGLTPEQSQQCIAVINGKPAMWGDDMLALVMAHKDFDDIIEEPILKGETVTGYSCTVKRKGKADKQNVFTLEMAKKAGLLGKVGPWTQYPERMLKLRARGFSLRDAFPDALKGIKPREEVEDYIEAEYKAVNGTGLSRTELLKKDYLSKKGEVNADTIQGLCAPSLDSSIRQEDSEEQESQSDEASGAQKINLCSEVKRLLDERQVPAERLAQALKYYEVEAVDELSDESAAHFIDQLMKL